VPPLRRADADDRRDLPPLRPATMRIEHVWILLAVVVLLTVVMVVVIALT
jgi:hypothetical protein